MKIYLAGKISWNDWRGSVIGHEPNVDVDVIYKAARTAEWEGVWPVSKFKIDGMSLEYVGPYFAEVGGHGLAHGDSTHGNGDPSSSCGDLHDLHDVDTEHDLVRYGVVWLCNHAIRSADLVLAWLDDSGAYGTMFELGYATALDKPVYLAGPGADHKDLWFARHGCRSTWGDTPKLALKNAIDLLHREPKSCVPAALARCESPLEQALLRAFWKCGMLPCCTDVGRVAESGELWIHAQPKYAMIPQYRPDFGVWCKGLGLIAIVEVDGHDYHERTKEQARHDKERDRAFLAAGVQTIRFTGSEVHHDAEGCAREALSLCRKILESRKSQGAANDSQQVQGSDA